MPLHRVNVGDLHGNVPDANPVALLLIDVINDLNFPGNTNLVKNATALGKRIAVLKRRCRKAGIPAIYVNDNHNKWRSDFRGVVAHCLEPDSLGRPLVELVMPEAEDYVVLKPKHSAFYGTSLNVLLAYLKTHAIIPAGLTTASCVLLTAGEIYVRDFQLYVPSDCVAALREKDHRNALNLIRKEFKATTTPASNLNIRKLVGSNRHHE
jgi:nicotinamidase-related amidase